MRKELLWAGIIGISFGLIIGFGVWRVKSKISQKNILAPSPTPQANLKGQLKIALNKPEDYSVTTESVITVSGITKSSSWVVASNETNDFITKAGNDGTFLLDVDLKSGVNILKVTSLNNQSETSTEKVLVVYSPSFQTSTPSPTSDSKSFEASSESDIDKAVALKVAQVGNNPKAYIGTVTDITDTTIQIKSMNSQIQQIETGNNDVNVVDSKGTTTKIVKLTDIAIGDFIVAMGYVDGDEVLDVQRILITNTLTETQITTSIKKVVKEGTKSIEVIETDGSTQTITPGKNTEIYSYLEGKTTSIKLSSITENEYVIVVSDTTGTPSITRSIFDIGQVN